MIFCSTFLLFLQIILGRGVLHFDQPCSKEAGSEQCNFDQGLVCASSSNSSNSTTCRCVNETHMEYNKLVQKCTVFLNSNCTWQNPSDTSEAIPVNLPCGDPNANCFPDTKLCQCESYYLPETHFLSGENRCLPAGARKSCNSSTLPCHPRTGMTCFNEECRCSHPVKQTTLKVGVSDHWNYDQCLGIPEIEGGCQESWDCIPNAYCGEDKKCHCEPGYIFRLNSSNYLKDGQSSSVAVVAACLVGRQGQCENDPGRLKPCNTEAGLFCLNGKCVCELEPDVSYDEVLRKCAAPKGHPCTLWNATSEVKSIYCQSGLKCEPFAPWGYLDFGTCSGSPASQHVLLYLIVINMIIISILSRN